MGTPAPFRSRPVASLVAHVFLLEAAGRGLVQVLSLLVARHLTPAAYGRFSLAVTVLSIAVIVAEMGGPDAAIQRLTGTRALDGIELFRSARTCAGGAVAVAAAVSSLLLALSGHSVAVVLGSVACLPVVMMQGAVAEARIEERPVRATTIAVLSSGSIFVGAYAGVLVEDSVLAAVIGSVLAAGTGWLYLLLRGWARWEAPSWDGLRSVTSAGAPFLVTALAVTTYTRGDRFFVAAFAGVRDLGFYAAAYTVVFAASLAGAAVQIVTFPRLRREFLEHGSTTAVWRRAGVILCAGAAGAVLLGFARAPLVAGLYGPHYSSAAPLVALLAPLVPFYLVNPYLANILMACNRQRALSRVAVVNLVVALVCYTYFTAVWGVTGTAVGSVLVEASGFFQMLVVVRRSAGPRGSVITASPGDG